mgnify:CR=1 FL=1
MGLLFLVGGGLFLFFQWIYPYHLFFKEQIQLFLTTPGYFFSLVEEPAGLSKYIGEFFTQFFYLRGGGPLVLSVWLLTYFLVVFFVLTTFFSKTPFLFILALFPVLGEFLMHTHVEYYLSSTVAMVLTIGLFLIYSRITRPFFSKTFGLVLIPLIYWIAGFHVFTFTILVLIHRLRIKNSFGLYEGLMVLFAFLIPFAGRYFFTWSLEKAFLVPYVDFTYLGGVFVFLFTIVAALFLIRWYALKRYLVTGITGVFLLIMILAGIGYYPHYNREKVFAVGTEAYFGNWTRVYKKARVFDMKNTIVSYYANIALARQDKLPSELLDFYQPFNQSLFLDVGPESDRVSVFYSGDVFFELGDMNLAQHSVMLGKIFSPKNRSSRMVRQLAEINLVIGEIDAAKKYLRILKQTLFHKEWALDLLRRVKNSEPLPRYLLQKQNLLPAKDILRKGGEYVSGLEVLVESNPENYMALDYLLCYHLLNKDLKSFKEAFDKYYDVERPGMPRLYSEALLIIHASGDGEVEDLREQKIRPKVMNQFMTYTKLYEAEEGYSEELEKKFHNTYWFYFHFAKPAHS